MLLVRAAVLLSVSEACSSVFAKAACSCAVVCSSAAGCTASLVVPLCAAASASVSAVDVSAAAVSAAAVPLVRVRVVFLRVVLLPVFAAVVLRVAVFPASDMTAVPASCAGRVSFSVIENPESIRSVDSGYKKLQPYIAPGWEECFSGASSERKTVLRTSVQIVMKSIMKERHEDSSGKRSWKMFMKAFMTEFMKTPSLKTVMKTYTRRLLSGASHRRTARQRVEGTPAAAASCPAKRTRRRSRCSAAWGKLPQVSAKKRVPGLVFDGRAQGQLP